MNALLKRIVGGATVPIEEMSTRFFKAAALVFAAAVCLSVSAAFLTVALFLYVQSLAGTAIAAFAAGSVYLAGAALILIIGWTKSRRTPEVPASDARLDAAEPGAFQPQNQALEQNIGEAVAPILGVLHDAGFERERLILLAGSEIAKQLNPFSLVTFAIVAGFIFGRALPSSIRGQRPG